MNDDPSAFNWRESNDGLLPLLEPHSEAKLRVLQDYVEDYIAILCSNSFGLDRFRVTLIDGFCGGGIYANNREGSPFSLLRAVSAAEARLNCDGRTKSINIDCEWHFVDEAKEHIICLANALENLGFGHKIGKSIFLHTGAFATRCDDILARLKKRHPREGGRAIFFLDQCGYSQVTPQLIRRISGEVRHAEYIINFAIEWLLDFVSDTALFRKRLQNLGLGNYLSAEEVIRAKDTQGIHWKFAIESLIGPAFRRAAQMPFFSPFYIEPTDSHRGYWLLHLAPHERARSAMVDIFWRHANNVRHFGNTGLNMLAYKPDMNSTEYFAGMTFNDVTRSNVRKSLTSDFARVVRDSHHEGTTFRDFAKLYCNQTMADESLMSDVLSTLAAEGEITITGPSGGLKRSQKISGIDIISPCTQFQLQLPWKRT
ncbi:MAG TPA: three-Cys-motif partner protein TcmP [Verrucomicrobiae bacterium]|nr:three-Cys-motif partner protein TcmP [Verrucomicrobiae bacterium]